MKNAIFVILLAVFFLVSCTTVWKVTNLNPETKHFPTSKKAFIVLSKTVDLNSKKALLVVPAIGDDSTYLREMVSKNGFFDEVIGFDELENRIIKANLTDKVPVINDRIGINNAAKYYKSFLWLNSRMRVDGYKSYEQFILTDALTMEDYFIGEILYAPIARGVSDQSVWYPLLNSLNDYLKEQLK